MRTPTKIYLIAIFVAPAPVAAINALLGGNFLTTVIGAFFGLAVGLLPQLICGINMCIRHEKDMELLKKNHNNWVDNKKNIAKKSADGLIRRRSRIMNDGKEFNCILDGRYYRIKRIEFPNGVLDARAREGVAVFENGTSIAVRIGPVTESGQRILTSMY